MTKSYALSCMRFVHLFSFLILSAYLAGCASSSQKAATGTPQKQGSVDTGKTGTQQAVTTIGCQPDTSSTAGTGTVGDTQLTLKFNNQCKSMQDILRATQKKVGIFQFSGFLCTSCKKVSQGLEQKLPSIASSKDILYVIVITDFRADFSDFDTRASQVLAEFPHAQLAHDEEVLVWKFLRSKPSERPLFVINQNLKSQIIRHELEEKINEDTQNTIAAAETLAASSN